MTIRNSTITGNAAQGGAGGPSYGSTPGGKGSGMGGGVFNNDQTANGKIVMDGVTITANRADVGADTSGKGIAVTNSTG